MELKYLATLKTILEAGSFQKAAEQLNYTQSTITLQMKLLEQALSVQLFEKIGRKMVLTQAGQELLPYVDGVLRAVGELEGFAKREGLTGALRIALPETLLSYQLQQVLSAFRKEAPQVALSLQNLNCYVIREQVLGGEADLGIHYDVGGYGPSLVVERLGSYPLALVASPDLGEADCDFVAKGQRKPVCLLTPDRASLYHKLFDSYLRGADITLAGEMVLGSVEAIKRGVMGNLGVAFLPRFTVEGELCQGLLRELPCPAAGQSLTAVCTYHKNKCLTPAMKLFIRLLKEHAPL